MFFKLTGNKLNTFNLLLEPEEFLTAEGQHSAWLLQKADRVKASQVDFEDGDRSKGAQLLHIFPNTPGRMVTGTLQRRQEQQQKKAYQNMLKMYL